MAKAPKPGVGRRIQIAEELSGAEQDWRKIGTDDGKEYLLRASAIGPQDEGRFAQETGQPIWSVWDNPSGMLPILSLYWFARLKNGERDLRFKKVLKEYPDLSSVIAAGFWIEIPDPEAEDDEEDEPVDPTESASS